jgi:hypothetical protein
MDAAPLPRDRDRLRALGNRLADRFKQYESARKLQELKWTRNLRQFLGEYDPEVKIDKERSQAYPRITRVKCISFLSRMMNLLFPQTEKNWGIEISPVPNLSREDLQQVLAEAQQHAQTTQTQLNDELIEQAIRDFAKKRADNLSQEVSDQLTEIGGSRNVSYVSLCRRVMLSGIMYGVGVMKGPFTRTQLRRTWQKDEQTGQYVATEVPGFRPHFEFVPIWEYYPDMSAKHFYQMDGQFQRMVMSMSQMRELADRPDFFGDTIKGILKNNPQGNFKEKQFESDLRTMGVSTNVSPNTTTKYEVLVWEGYVSAEDIKACGVVLPEGFEADTADASIWMVDNQIIKGDVSPWLALEPDQRTAMYHHFLFEEDDSNLMGNGLPNIMRDSQMAIAAATRMLLDNASVTCGPNLEVNVDLLRPGQDVQTVQPYKLWSREGMGAEAQWPAVREINIASHIPELKEVVEMFMDFADRETFVNPATGGDMQGQPSEPMRTAAGASMIHGMAALPFKDAVHNFDTFTISVVQSLILFNKHFNPDPNIRGDFQPIARGSTSLIAKEVRGMALDNLAATLQPEERPYLNWHKLLTERLRVRDVDASIVVVSDLEANMIDQQNQAKAAEQAASAKEMLTAQIRETLASAVKSLTQSDANSAKADAATQKQTIDVYNAMLKGLESGVTPADVHAATQGAQLPDAIAKGFRKMSGKDKTPTPKEGEVPEPPPPQAMMPPPPGMM